MKTSSLSLLVRGLAALAALPLLAAAAPGIAAAPSELEGSLFEDGGRESTMVVTLQQQRAVDAGLAWLAAHQAEDGSWSGKIGYKLNEDYMYTADRGHVGVTALAGMAFLAGGELPGRGKYGANIERCLDFVLSCVQDDGYITHAGTRMYSHAFATLFLAEIYGMTHRQDVRSKLQKAVDFVVKSQNAEGGWRYEPYAVESDMSIVVCQVLALRAARNIGIRVPKATVDRAARYVVDSAVTEDSLSGFGHPSFTRGSEIGSFHYQKDVHSRSSFPLTAAGVTALHGLGIYSDEAIQRGVQYMMRELPGFNHKNGDRGRGRGRGHYFFWYGHYYGVQAMYTVGSPYWEPYFEEVRDILVAMQEPDGSWPNATGPGPVFGTAMAVLILEIPYRFLPIFQR